MISEIQAGSESVKQGRMRIRRGEIINGKVLRDVPVDEGNHQTRLLKRFPFTVASPMIAVQQGC